jgi:hypothetical protein
MLQNVLYIQRIKLLSFSYDKEKDSRNGVCKRQNPKGGSRTDSAAQAGKRRNAWLLC